MKGTPNGINTDIKKPYARFSLLFQLRSFLSRSRRALLPLPVWVKGQFREAQNKAICGVLLGGACFLIQNPCSAAVNVSFSTSAPTLQSDFIGATTSQYFGSLVASPYFSNTYTLTLMGKRNYTPLPPVVVPVPIPTASAVDQCMAYGFGSGQDYERTKSLKNIEDYSFLCSSPTAFGSNVSFSSGTCATVIYKIYNVIYQQNFSTPTVRWN